MCGKIKSILLLILLLIMIYYQHSPVIHAEDHENTWEVEQIKDEGNEISEERKEKSETEGDTEEKEGSEKDKSPEEEGSEEEGSEDESCEEDYKGSDTETEQITKFELEIPEADGKNGYYVTVPVICITHVSQKGKTVYCLENNGKTVIQGKLGNAGDKLVLSGGQFAEGKNTLTVFMEDEAGVKLDDTVQKKRILLDTEIPEIMIDGPADRMTVKQIAEVRCRVFESNRLLLCKADIEWKDTDGRRQTVPDAEWSMRLGISESLFAFSENGTYYMEISAEDEAGNFNKKELQFTISSQMPVAENMEENFPEQEGQEESELVEAEFLLSGFRDEFTEDSGNETMPFSRAKTFKEMPQFQLVKTGSLGEEKKKSAEKISKEGSSFKRKEGECLGTAVICAVCGAGGILYTRRKKS